MPRQPFNRHNQATFYGRRHLEIDPGVQQVIFLPDAPDREIRFVEVNTEIPEMSDDRLEPLDFGVDRGEDVEHRLLILDVTPSQWERIKNEQITLPLGWSMLGSLRMDKSSDDWSAT